TAFNFLSVFTAYGFRHFMLCCAVLWLEFSSQSCNPDMCKFLVDFGAIMEKVNCMEAKLKESEARLKDTEMSLKETVTQLKQDSETKLNHTANRLKESENQILELQHKGVFTAPIAGVYYFTLFYHAGGSHTEYLFLHKNSEVMVMTNDHVTHSDVADNGGDKVYVRMAANSHVWASESQTTFSGFLVTQM
uniref:C1q domain-containing protein n=1 Tax=Pundamilia nyererei TaxID=303518 RepID=A0A3B4H171_9CICH